MADFKVVGKGVALKRGHYPVPAGSSRIIPEGQSFDVYEGLEKATWFTFEAAPKAAPVKKGKPQVEPDDIA